MAKFATIRTLDTPDLVALHSSGELLDCLPYFGTLDLSAVTIRKILEFVKLVSIKDIFYLYFVSIMCIFAE